MVVKNRSRRDATFIRQEDVPCRASQAPQDSTWLTGRAARVLRLANICSPSLKRRRDPISNPERSRLLITICEKAT